MMNEYEKQAKEFCEKFGVTIDINYLKTDKHFKGDDEKRDIYLIKITRGKKEYIFNFGDSIHNTEKRKLAILKRKQPKKPNEYDILSVLQTYDIDSFDDFVSGFGYEFNTEREYIEIKQLYFTVVDEYKNVMQLFSDCIDELSEIQ